MATTPTEWYTSLPGVESVRAPENRSGAGGGGFPRSPLEGNFHKQRRALQNALAKKQLEMMQEKLKQAREGTLQQREDRILAPIKEAYARANAPRPPRKAPTGTNYGTTAKSFFDMMGGHRKPGDVRAMADWLKFIGPGRAHAGMMQSGQLLGSGTVTGGSTYPGGDQPVNEVPVAEAGRPGTRVAPRSVTRVGVGGVPLSREKGGTIPETGPYELHEGEVVVSADQVDRPLLAALKADKLSKMHSGQMDGKGTGPGPPTAKSMVKDEFRGGTMGSYRAGSLTWDEMAEAIAMQRMEAGNQLPMEIDRGPSGLPSFPPDRKTADYMDWLASGERTPPGGADWIDPEKKEGLGPLSAKFFEDVDPFVSALKSGASGFAGSMGWRGRGGGEEEAAPGKIAGILGAEAEPLPMGRDTSLAPMVGPQEDLEKAGGMINERTIDRARDWREGGGEGPLGSAEDPLTMVASGPADPDSWTEQMKDPELRKADMERTMASLNTQKADRLQNYLMQNAGEMDPQTFKSIQDQANQLKAINKSERDRQDLKDENAKDRIVEMEKAYSDYQGQLARAQATGQASQNVGLRQAEGQLRSKLERYELKFLEGVEDGWSRDVLGAYVDAMFDIKAKLEGVDPGDPGYQEERDAYINYQMSVLGEQ